MSNNRRNHDFQIAYFLAGKCSTPDGAYALLCDLEEERVLALSHSQVAIKRENAKELRARKLLESEDAADRLEAEADLEELANNRLHAEILVKAAKDELDFIRQCKDKLEPIRKYAHLSLPEAHEAIQQEEWCQELIRRAENYLCTGPLPADQLDVMRCHPDFATKILPALNEIQNAVAAGKRDLLLTRQTSQWSPVALLTSP